MTKIQLREYIVAQLNEVRSLMLTNSEYKTLEYIRDYGRCTTFDAAGWFNLTIPAASARLRKLYLKGYTQRHKLQDPTGGYYYEYSFNLRGIKSD